MQMRSTQVGDGFNCKFLVVFFDFGSDSVICGVDQYLCLIFARPLFYLLGNRETKWDVGNLDRTGVCRGFNNNLDDRRRCKTGNVVVDSFKRNVRLFFFDVSAKTREGLSRFLEKPLLARLPNGLRNRHSTEIKEND